MSDSQPTSLAACIKRGQVIVSYVEGAQESLQLDLPAAALEELDEGKRQAELLIRDLMKLADQPAVTSKCEKH